jgi:glutaredoxin
MDSFTGLNAQVLGISVDHIPCLTAWAESLGGINYPLLSDFWPHGAVSELYGVFRANEGKSERAIFVIDKDGFIRYIDIHDIDDRPDNEEVRKALREIQSQEVTQTTVAAADVSLLEGQPASLTSDGIILYCARWCKDCRRAKAWLDERGLTYVEVDIDFDQEARNQVRRWGNGRLITPVIDMYGTIVLDYDPPRMEEVLRRHSAG